MANKNAENELEKLIHKLLPFKDLAVGDRTKLAKTGRLVKYPSGVAVYSNECKNKLVYVVKGKLDLCIQYLQPQLIDAQFDGSLSPVFAEKEEPDSHFIPVINSMLWQFDRLLFNRLIEKEVIVDEGDDSYQLNHVETNIYSGIMQAVEVGQLKLPSLPEIALRIKKAVENADTDIDQIAKIIELDPAISTRLIKVANSPLTRGAHPIHTMRDVIVRLGLKMTRNLVLSFSMVQLFKTQQPYLKKQMKIFYSHSIEIASICFVLGKHIKHLDADELLLAGLIHDIGVIPIITYIEKTGLEVSTAEEINQLISSLRIASGILVVKSWDLPKEMFNVVTHAEDWLYNSGDSLCVEDVIIIAQIYDNLKRKKLDKLPDIKNVPAFKKLFPEKYDADFSMQILEEAKDEINEMKLLLGL